jgi:hypothetical protein
MNDGGSVVYIRRRFRDRLLALLANDSVRSFIWVYYGWFIAGSIHGTFWAYPIPLIVDPMGQAIYDAWVWMPLVAGPIALGGLALRSGGSPAADIDHRLLRREHLGLWMQVGGHGAMCVVLSVYIGAAIYGAQPHQPIPSVFYLCAYLMGVAFLGTQCVYKVILARRYGQ